VSLQNLALAGALSAILAGSVFAGNIVMMIFTTGVLNRFDAAMRLSMTYDQGREMARHENLSERTGLKVYFAHPHSPWERGRNENTNGLLRQYLPKGEDLSGYSQLQLDQIAASLNARPRKSLGWKCPAELFLPDFDFVKYYSKFFALRS